MTKRYAWFGIVVALGVAAACSSEAPKPAPAPPTAAAPAPPLEPRVKVFITNEASGDLTVIDADTQTLVGTFPLGKRPRGIKASPDGKSLFVALSGSPNAGPGVDPKRRLQRICQPWLVFLVACSQIARAGSAANHQNAHSEKAREDLTYSVENRADFARHAFD